MDAAEYYYYRLRLEHTIQHTQQSTRLIYLVNGAVLALLYFVAQIPVWLYQHVFLSCIVGSLSLINLVHTIMKVSAPKINIPATAMNTPVRRVRRSIGMLGMRRRLSPAQQRHEQESRWRP